MTSYRKPVKRTRLQATLKVIFSYDSSTVVASRGYSDVPVQFLIFQFKCSIFWFSWFRLSSGPFQVVGVLIKVSCMIASAVGCLMYSVQFSSPWYFLDWTMFPVCRLTAQWPLPLGKTVEVRSSDHSANSEKAEERAARRLWIKGGAAGAADDLWTCTLHPFFCSILYMIKDNLGGERRWEVAVGQPDWTGRLACQEGNLSALPKACYTSLCEWRILSTERNINKCDLKNVSGNIMLVCSGVEVKPSAQFHWNTRMRTRKLLWSKEWIQEVRHFCIYFLFWDKTSCLTATWWEGCLGVLMVQTECVLTMGRTV